MVVKSRLCLCGLVVLRARGADPEHGREGTVVVVRAREALVCLIVPLAVDARGGSAEPGT